MFVMFRKCLILLIILAACSEICLSVAEDLPMYLVDQRIRLPCNSKFPEYNLSISNNGKEIKFYTNPRNVSLQLLNPTSGLYKCEIKNHDQIIEEKIFNVTSRKYEDSPPKMRKEPYAFESKTIRLVCTVEFDEFSRQLKAMKWKTPLQDLGRINIYRNSSRHPKLANFRIHSSIMDIVDATYMDAGNYTCSTGMKNVGQREFIEQQVSINLTVYELGYMKLEMKTDEISEKMIVGQDGVLKVSIDTHLKPVIRWFNLRGREIQNSKSISSKYQIETIKGLTKLRIRRLTMADMGNYIVEAIVPNSVTTSLNVPLVVWENRLIQNLRNIRTYYMENETASIECLTASSPISTIIWSFEKDQQSLPRLLRRKDKDVGPRDLIVEFQVESSGKIACEACDYQDCQIVKREIVMTDVPGGFGIISPKKNFTIGESIEVICAASMSNFRANVEWLDKSHSPLISTDRVKITKTNTSLSYHVVLSIESIEKNDQNVYICKGSDKNNSVFLSTYNLNVYDPKVPSITKTNMNKPELKFNIGLSSLKPIILSCYVTGLPEPVITWSKDDVRIEPGIPSKFGRCEFGFWNESQELQIEYLYKECSGEYRCRAENRVDFTEAHQKILIEGTELSQILIILNVILVVLSFSLIICCWVSKLRMRERLISARFVQSDREILDSLICEMTDKNQADVSLIGNKREFTSERKISTAQRIQSKTKAKIV